jgi:hypothetical protein
VLQNDFNREENGYSAHALTAEQGRERKRNERRILNGFEALAAVETGLVF